MLTPSVGNIPPIKRSNWRENARRFNEACDWLRSAGIVISPTRAAAYEKLLGKIAEHHENGTIDSLVAEHGHPALLNAVVEASEFTDIHAAFAGTVDVNLMPLLRSYVDGAVMLSDETMSANRPRNIGFELSVAAAAKAAGLPVYLAPPADVSIPLNPHPFFVECKRPFSKAKVANRIRHGLRQLVRRYDSAADPGKVRGFLAVSISRIEHGGSSQLEVEDETDLQVQMTGIIDRFLRRYKHYWESGADPRTLAVMIHLRAPCLLRSPSLIVVATRHDFAMIYPEGSANREIFEAIAKPFRRLAADESL